MTDTRVVDNPEAGRFDILVDGEPAGFAAYRRKDSTITFTHTEVDPRFEGRGLGSVLVRHALDAVRVDALSVVAQCPFVRQYIERHQEYADLLVP